jgi:hypothetical protein
MFSLIVLCVLHASIPAQDGSKTFAVRNAGNVTDAARGFSFGTPEGWEAVTRAEGYYFTNAGKTIILAIRPHKYSDFEAYWKDTGSDRGDLTLTVQPRDENGVKYYRGTKSVAQGIVFDSWFLLSPFGGGMRIDSIAQTKAAHDSFKIGSSIAASARFTRPKPSPVEARVRKSIVGMLLTYRNPTDEHFPRREIALCRSGAGYLSTDPAGITTKALANREVAGKWEITPDGKFLVITTDSGDIYEYRVELGRTANSIVLNDKRYAVRTQRLCM